jgi:hypothetical protein
LVTTKLQMTHLIVLMTLMQLQCPQNKINNILSNSDFFIELIKTTNNEEDFVEIMKAITNLLIESNIVAKSLHEITPFLAKLFQLLIDPNVSF